MAESFEEDEFFEDEWVDVYDVEGRKASLRHLATVRIHGNTYMILGEMQEEEPDKGRLMLIREEQTDDGVTQYVVTHDEAELEQVMSHFAMHLLMEHLDELPPELAQELSAMEMNDRDEIFAHCGCRHKPGEFCFCGDPALLQ